MKLTWEILDEVRYDGNKFYLMMSGRKRFYYIYENCEKCGCYYITRDDNAKSCGSGCSQKGVPREYTQKEKHWAWKGGITEARHKCVDCGKMIILKSKRCRECFKKFQREENHPTWKGGISRPGKCKKCGNPTRSGIKTGLCVSCFWDYNKGKNNPMYGRCGEKSNHWKNKPINYCENCGKELRRGSKAKVHIECYIGEYTSAWKNGISREPYCDVWADKEYKNWIKYERDEGKCQNPHCNGRSTTLCLHHINYNKKDCRPSNLISICNSCNIGANYNREWYEAFYNELIRRKTKNKGCVC